MDWLLVFLVLLVSNIATALLVTRHDGAGVLKIDHSNPERDTYRFEIDDLENIRNKHRLILKIDHNADLSQK